MNRITLKNIKFSETFSEETNCFKGDIYFDNKRVGHCENEGRGGNTFCYPYGIETKEKFNEMLEYCETLPDIEYHSSLTGFETFSVKSTIDNVVDTLFESWLKEKEKKKMEKNFSKGICFGNDYSYQISSVKQGGKSVSIDDLLKTSHGITFLKNLCEEKKKEGHTIFNTNLPFEV